MSKWIVIIIIVAVVGAVAFALRESISCFFYLRTTHQGQVAFLRDDGVYVMDSNGSNQCKIAEANAYLELAWSPTSQQLALMNLDGNIYTVNSDGSDLHTVVTAAWTEDRLVPSWSPDGTQITYIRRSDTTDVYVADVVTGSERQVTQGLMALFPVWSPEEDWIAFVTEDNALYVVRADGSELRQLSDQASFDPPTWSPDGERLAFINRGYEISIVDLNGSEEEIISDFRDEFNGQTFYVTWSPTENQIAAEVIVRNPPTRVNLFLVDAETGTASPLSPREYQATWTSWTPSGEFLLFDRIQSSAALQESEIYRVDAHSGENILLAIGGKAVSNAG